MITTTVNRILINNGNLKFVLPHHTLDRLVRLTAIFRVFLFIVFDGNFAIRREIDQLPDRHTLIHFYRLLDRDLQCPVTTEPNITFAGRGMYIDPESTCRRFAFKKRYMSMSFG